MKKTWIERWSLLGSGKSIVLFFLAFLILYLLTDMVFPLGLQHISEMTHGIGPLDTERYLPEDVYPHLESLGPQARAFYWKVLLTSDMIIPILFRIMLMAILAYSLIPWWKNHGPLILLSLLPLSSALADVLENSLIVYLILQLPKEFPRATLILSGLTRYKWISNYLEWGVTGLLLIIGIIKRIKIKGDNK